MSKKYTTEEIQQMLDSTAYIDKNAGSKPVEVDTLAEAEELGNNYPTIIAQLIAEREMDTELLRKLEWEGDAEYFSLWVGGNKQGKRESLCFSVCPCCWGGVPGWFG